MEDKNTHCCNDLTFAIEQGGGESVIVYLPQTRTYMIPVSENQAMDILYCPFCGKDFPPDLTSELTRIIYDELALGGYDDPRLPFEFKTNAWWKSRGL